MIDHQPTYNKILNARVALQLDKSFVAVRVKHQSLGPEGNIVGRYNSNPMMNSMIYGVEFPDVQVKDYAAYFIYENILSQFYDKEYSFNLVD